MVSELALSKTNNKAVLAGDNRTKKFPNTKKNISSFHLIRGEGLGPRPMCPGQGLGVLK